MSMVNPPEHDEPYCCRQCELEECLLDMGRECPTLKEAEESDYEEQQSNPCYNCRGNTNRAECEGCAGKDSAMEPTPW
jgi:hypothetical protein